MAPCNNCEKMEKADKKDRILSAALDLFLERGYNDTKISAIAEKAGIGKGTVYEYFDSKDQLFAELFRTTILERYRKVGEIPKMNGNMQEKLLAFCRFEMQTVDIIKQGKGVKNIIWEAEIFKRPVLRNFIIEMQKHSYNALKEIIEQGIENGTCQVTDVPKYVAAIIGAIQYYIALGYNLFPEDDAPQLKDLDSSVDWTPEKLTEILLYGLTDRVKN